MPPKTHKEMYVGYQASAPPRLARFVRNCVLALLAGVALVATAAAFDQGPFSDGVFEFGVEREFEGVVVATPFPVLHVDRSKLPDAAPDVPDYLLVAFGKHGAQDEIADFAGQKVQLRGTLIHGSEGAMIELVAGSITALGDAPMTHPDGEPLGTMTVQGEIVDSKCYLGVMKPGRGKTHRSCASLCIRGGIPPAFRLLGDPVAGAQLLLLTDTDGNSLNDRVLEWVAEPIELTGQARRYGGLVVLATDPASFTPLPQSSEILTREG